MSFAWTLYFISLKSTAFYICMLQMNNYSHLSATQVWLFVHKGIGNVVKCIELSPCSSYQENMGIYYRKGGYQCTKIFELINYTSEIIAQISLFQNSSGMLREKFTLLKRHKQNAKRSHVCCILSIVGTFLFNDQRDEKHA